MRLEARKRCNIGLVRAEKYATPLYYCSVRAEQTLRLALRGFPRTAFPALDAPFRFGEKIPDHIRDAIDLAFKRTDKLKDDTRRPHDTIIGFIALHEVTEEHVWSVSRTIRSRLRRALMGGRSRKKEQANDQQN